MIQIKSFLLFILLSNACYSQVIISRIGDVVFFYTDSVNEKENKRIADICNWYLWNVNKTPQIIYLDIGVKEKESYYKLGYDNAYGNAICNDIYNRKTWDYTTLGIRITAYTTKDSINAEHILKLLRYGIDRKNDLKKRFKKARDQDFYDRPKTIEVDSKEIKRILK